MYRSKGLQIVPGRAGEKRPLVEWSEFRGQFMTPTQFDRWFDPKTGEHRNLRAMGLLTGACSKALLVNDETEGLFVVDLDVKDTANGLEWWTTFIEVYLNGIEPETWMARSGGGGLHIYFLAPKGWIPPTFKAPTFGVDCRGQGGYIVAPPSLHPNGKLYEWVEGFEPWTIPLAMAPLELTVALDELKGAPSGSTGQHERTAAAATVKNALGLDIDGREKKLADWAWALVVDLRRQSPIPPVTALLDAETQAAFDRYCVTTKSRLAARPGMDKAQLLEREDRGLAALRRKVAYAMAKWDDEVAAAANMPKPDAQTARAVDADRPLGTQDKRDDGAKGDNRDGQDGSPAEPPKSFVIDSLPSLVSMPLPKRENVLAPILPRQSLSMISAARGVGKTLVAHGMGYAAATGGRFLRWSADTPRKVLLIDGEMPASLLQARASTLIASSKKELPSDDFFRILAMDRQALGVALNLADPEHQRRIEDQLDSAEFLIFDNISTLVSSGRENDADSWDIMQGWLLQLRRQGLTVQLVAHAGRNGSPRGTSKREDVLDTIIQLKRPADYDPREGARFEVEITKGRGLHGEDAAPFEAHLEVHDGADVWVVSSIRNMELEAVVALTREGKSVRDIAQELSLDRNKVNRLQHKARGDGVS